MKRYIKTYTIKPKQVSIFTEAVDEYIDRTKEDSAIIECHINHIDSHSFTHFISFENSNNENSYKQEIYAKKFEDTISKICDKITDIQLTEEGVATGLRPSNQDEEKKEQEAISLYKKQEDIDNII